MVSQPYSVAPTDLSSHLAGNLCVFVALPRMLGFLLATIKNAVRTRTTIWPFNKAAQEHSLFVCVCMCVSSFPTRLSVPLPTHSKDSAAPLPLCTLHGTPVFTLLILKAPSEFRLVFCDYAQWQWSWSLGALCCV